MKFLVFLLYFILFHAFSKELEIEIFFSGNINDTDIIEFPNNSNYRHVKIAANWQNSYGDYGILKCLFNISMDEYNKNAKLFGYCDGKDQDNQKFWLEFKRDTEDFDAGIGKSKFIFGEGKYENLVGTKCIYAVKVLDENAFSKHKCKIK